LQWLKLQTQTSSNTDINTLLARAADYDSNNLFSGTLYGGEGITGFSLRNAFFLGIESAKNEKELQQHVMDLAEMAYVQTVYSSLHGQWHPTTNSGQDPQWKEHRAFHRKLSKLRGRYED
jgi:hypothetical protein